MSVPAIQGQQALDVQALISQAISASTPVETMERLVDLAIRMRDVQAREAYSTALAAFQGECPPIFKTEHAKIRTRTGPGFEYTYASLDGVLEIAQPVANKHGLSISWKVRSDEKAAFVRCLIRHALGHTEEGDELRIPIELTAEGGSGASPAQRVGVAVMYGKRQTALAALGVAPQKNEDTDGKTPESSGHEEPGQHDEPGQVTTISEGQERMFHAVARGHGWNDEQKHDLLAGYRLNHAKEISVAHFDAIIKKLKERPAAQKA